MGMYKDNQERVDAYLRGEMDAEQKIQFEIDLETDSSLRIYYLQTKAITNALVDSKTKLNQMARWDKEEEIRLRFVSRRKNIRRWTIGMSAAACIAVGFFAIRPMFMTTSFAPGYDYAMPNFGSEVYSRGNDSSMEYLDSLISVKDYEKALACVDSLLFDYREELEQYETMDSLNEKETYNKQICEDNLSELEWRLANLLIALGKTDEAKDALKSISLRDNEYIQQADSLLNNISTK